MIGVFADEWPPLRPNKLAEELVPGLPDPDDDDDDDEPDPDMFVDDDDGRREVVALRVRRGRAGVMGRQEVGSPTRYESSSSWLACWRCQEKASLM